MKAKILDDIQVYEQARPAHRVAVDRNAAQYFETQRLAYKQPKGSVRRDQLLALAERLIRQRQG